ncbi:HD-GYP domain-containing protein [Thalassotalea castellviae]|uniref:HD-GYP domain-containing protein n=1 Tax=Thalassotalea castellviae TaxID=3075612 RepID=A0ABU3A2F9_9GAMM|nr:HD-GYP domain-containing protein [Thalassotalea sp. W431]MDT0603283.1 HD-GYP domain-containing protein [Thalassotalea sp. W431]
MLKTEAVELALKLKVLDKRMMKEIEISALEVGHYVVKIVKQVKQFTLTQPGHIKSDLVIKNMAAKGVISLLIDTSKTKKEHHPRKNKNAPVIMDVYKAKELFTQSKAIQKQVFSDAQSGKPLDLSPVEKITDETINEIFKNPDALACVINIRNTDEYLLEHSVSVSVLMTIFARFLKVEKPIIQELSIGAFLHDVGKIMVPENILNKPGKLTTEEFSIMKTHVNHSIDIIKKTPGISALSLEVAALHHEKLDGNGYPFNVVGDDISTYGRMISICDIFDALTANRCYKKGYNHIKAFNILRKLAESNHLDQRLVNLFIKCMGVYPVGSLVELNSNKIAIVEERNIDDPTNPKVRYFYNSEKNNYVMAEDIDLAKNDDFIVKGVRADDFDLNMNKIIEFLLMQG